MACMAILMATIGSASHAYENFCMPGPIQDQFDSM